MKKFSQQTKKVKTRKIAKGDQIPLNRRRKGVVGNSILWSALFVVITSYLLTHLSVLENAPQDYALGGIADTDIKAPRDIQYEDVDATRAKAAEAASAVPPVFDFDSEAQDKLAEDLTAAFSAARDLIGEVMADEASAAGRPEATHRNRTGARTGAQGESWLLIAGVGREETLARFSPLFAPFKPNEPTAEELETLIRLRFAKALEDEMVKSCQKMFTSGYLGGNYVSAEPEPKRIVWRDIRSGTEREIGIQEIVKSVEEAETRIRRRLDSNLELAAEDVNLMASFLGRAIKPNLFFNRNLTLQRQKAAQEDVGKILVHIQKGKLIARHGDEITAEKLRTLHALRVQESRQPTSLLVFLGTAIAISLMILSQWRFIREHARLEPIHGSSHLLVMLIMVISLLSAKLYYLLINALQESVVSVSWADSMTFKLGAPLAIGSMLVVLLVGSQIGYMFAIVFSLFLGYLLEGNAVLLFYTFIGNMAAIYGLGMSPQKQRGALWKASFVVAAANCLVILGDGLRTSPFPDIRLLFGQLGLGIIGPILLTLPIVYLAMYLLETIFGITTDIRLLELSNTNEPLLKQLQIQAPGTFHHSLMVANLAEPAAEAVNAHSLFVRVASLYHDVGKINKPEYFIENQEYGTNKHDKLASSMSSLILISHVKDGLDLAKVYKLPSGIRDVIRQHHGTKLIHYFFERAKERAKPDHGEVNESDYRYPGPKPQTRESAIIMLADAIEAASRTLTDPSPAKLKGLVKKIVETGFADQQLDDCDLTLRDLEKISTAFLRVLASFHHQRIDYPGFKFDRQEDLRKPKGASGNVKLLEWKLAQKKRQVE